MAPSMSVFVAAVAVTAAALVAPAAASQGWSECTEMWVQPGWYPSEQEGAARVCREGFIGNSYDAKMLTVGFSAYFVTPARVANLVPGRDTFYEDPDLQAMGVAQAPVDSHAFNQSWNRGHCAPSHIMSWSTQSKESCYTMANIAPQGGKFNQQTWADLEEHVLAYIGSSGNSLHIITGVAYKDRSNPSRTFDNIGVPDYYWKVLCDKANGQSVGFYGHNLDIISEECHTPHPVSEVEKIYGGALFPNVCNPNSLNTSHWFTISS